ncbi:MAG: poly(R)-hydroxyalkanoic acid synthase subunit PhaE [Steroidobacteraceae bacterium]
MTSAFGGQPDWWSLFTRAPFMGMGPMGQAMGQMAPPPGGAGGAALQQFIAACEQHIALMQSMAAEITAGASGGSSLFDRLSAWQGKAGGAGVDPFAILRELGTIGVPSGHAQVETLRRLNALQARALELQGRMLAHGAEIARDAMQRFAARAAQDPAAALSSLYAAWIDCAEEAYASRAHREDYCQAQAELTNTLNALRVEQRSQIEEWARVLDLPTRTEVNALIQRISALEGARPPEKKPRPAPRRGSAKRSRP